MLPLKFVLQNISYILIVSYFLIRSKIFTSYIKCLINNYKIMTRIMIFVYASLFFTRMLCRHVRDVS